MKTLDTTPGKNKPSLPEKTNTTKIPENVTKIVGGKTVKQKRKLPGWIENLKNTEKIKTLTPQNKLKNKGNTDLRSEPGSPEGNKKSDVFSISGEKIEDKPNGVKVTQIYRKTTTKSSYDSYENEIVGQKSQRGSENNSFGIWTVGKIFDQEILKSAESDTKIEKTLKSGEEYLAKIFLDTRKTKNGEYKVAGMC